METEEEVDILMSSDIYSATLSTKSITFTRAQTGWLFREDKTVSLFVILKSPSILYCCVSNGVLRQRRMKSLGLLLWLFV